MFIDSKQQTKKMSEATDSVGLLLATALPLAVDIWSVLKQKWKINLEH